MRAGCRTFPLSRFTSRTSRRNSNMRLPGSAAMPACQLWPLVIERSNARVLDTPRISLREGDAIR
jgi:hypothetical protein